MPIRPMAARKLLTQLMFAPNIAADGRAALAPQVVREPCAANARRAYRGGRHIGAACRRLLGPSGRGLPRLRLAASAPTRAAVRGWRRAGQGRADPAAIRAR